MVMTQRKTARQPTLKHIKTVNILVEKGGSVSGAMREAGYSPKTAENPSKLTRSQGFQSLMEQMGISDSRLVQKLDEGLEATKAVVMGVKSEDSFVDVQPDFAVRHKYVETTLRLKGLGKEAGDINIQFNNIAKDQRGSYDLA